jgi:hypothetical protein
MHSKQLYRYKKIYTVPSACTRKVIAARSPRREGSVVGVHILHRERDTVFADVTLSVVLQVRDQRNEQARDTAREEGSTQECCGH